MLNIDVFAPIPSPRVMMATRVKPGERRRSLMAMRTSRRSVTSALISMSGHYASIRPGLAIGQIALHGKALGPGPDPPFSRRLCAPDTRRSQNRDVRAGSADLREQPGKNRRRIRAGREDRVDDVDDAAALHDQAQALQQGPGSVAECGQTQSVGELEAFIAEDGEGEMEASRHL